MKRGCKQVANEGLGNDLLWLVYDANGIYTGHTLWQTRRMAIYELKFRMDKLPRDGKWRVRKVKVKVIS